MARWLARVLIVLTLLVGVASTADAQRRSRRRGGAAVNSGPTYGAHIGYNFDADAALLGAQLTWPISSDIGFYPTFDYYFVDNNTLWALILIYPSFTIPFATWLLMGFFKTIPQELEDAALVDGCSRLKALYRIVLPISLPGLLTVVIFAFSLCVNEFIYALTFISTNEQWTVSAGVPNALIRGDVFFWQSLMAAVLIPTIPLALLYNAFLDRFIKGFTVGAFR